MHNCKKDALFDALFQEELKNMDDFHIRQADVAIKVMNQIKLAKQAQKKGDKKKTKELIKQTIEMIEEHQKELIKMLPELYRD